MSYKGKSVLAIIPARGGSEGIPLKNLAKIGDKTLVGHAIMAAHCCKLVDFIAVSTDHPDIKREAESCPIIDRPLELSTGKVGDVAVLTHAYNSIVDQYGFSQDHYEIILMLQPTSPFRRPEHLTQAIEKLVDGDYDSVWSVSPIRDHPWKALGISKLKTVDSLYYYDHFVAPRVITRQDLPPMYRRNGVVYAMTRECLLEKKTLLTDNTGYLLLDDFQISIDTPEDLILANLWYKYKETNP